MKHVAIWKDHAVIGYCMMNEETRDEIKAALREYSELSEVEFVGRLNHA